MLKWNNVSVKIRTTVLLQNIDFEIRKGESFGLPVATEVAKR